MLNTVENKPGPGPMSVLNLEPACSQSIHRESECELEREREVNVMPVCRLCGSMRVRTAEVPDVRVHERAVEEVERAERSEAVLDARVRVHERHHAVEAEFPQAAR